MFTKCDGDAKGILQNADRWIVIKGNKKRGSSLSCNPGDNVDPSVGNSNLTCFDFLYKKRKS